MRSNPPLVAKWILHTASTITVAGLGWLTQRCRACRERTPIYGIYVFHVHVDHCRHRSASPRPAASRPHVTECLFGSKCLSQKFNEAVHILHDEIRRYRVKPLAD